MAIEWDLWEVSPVGRLQLTQAADRMAIQLLGRGVLDFSLSLSSARGLTSSDLFSGEIYATCEGSSALVDIEAGPIIEDSGEIAEPFAIVGTVSSWRTLFSVALGVIVALAWLEQGGGELEGSGLESYFHKDDMESLIARFKPPILDGSRNGLDHIAHEIVGADSPMTFA